ncbi:MAG: dCTP deaminase, partial [Methanocalculus sp. MSAO_Arc2]
MILVDWQIIDRVNRGYIMIDPFDPGLVQPNSLDIRL